MADKQKIGWIGLGKMGDPMSQNLLKAGYQVTVWNRSQEKAKAVVDAGATLVGSIAEVVKQSDVVISMISDDPVLESVSAEVFGAAAKGTIYIDMSTVSPVASARVAEAAAKAGVKYLRAPVSGSTALATAATLTIFASGPKDAYETCVEIFNCMGQKAFHVGADEEARHLKLVMNMMVGLTAAMVGEALTFGKKGGIDWDDMIDIVGASVAASPLFGYKSAILKERNFAPAFTVAQIAKDFDIALETAKSNDTAMPLTSIVRQFYGVMKAKGKGELDFFAYVTEMEEMSGIKS
jgi:3-hydroxyisobutyrate dehydrogenase-like beta-hydroxyacid dehydrogenase